MAINFFSDQQWKVPYPFKPPLVQFHSQGAVTVVDYVLKTCIVLSPELFLTG